MNKSAKVMIAISLLMSTSTVSASALAKPSRGENNLAAHVEATLIVKFKDSLSSEKRAAISAQSGAIAFEQLSPLADSTFVMKFPSEEHAIKVMDALSKNPNISFAEPDYLVTAGATSNDPYVTDSSLWGMLGGNGSYGSNAVTAWDAGYTGNGSVAVGIIDEGIQLTHPDLAANIWINPGEIAKNKKDDDGNGYIDDINGWDFANNDNTIYDGGLINPQVDRHGTHVAGTIGAIGGNGKGVAGISWNVELISAKFLGKNGGTISNAIRAVDYLTALKVRGEPIVASNNSWGGGGYSQAFKDALDRGGTAGVMFIAAAGNSGSNNDSVANYPSNYICAADCLIAVAAIEKNGALASFSSYGSTTVDIGAPGVGIWSTMAANTYASYSGTSMATPHVSGAVALLASKCPAISLSVVKSKILDTGATTTSLIGKTVSGKRLNVAALLASSCS